MHERSQYDSVVYYTTGGGKDSPWWSGSRVPRTAGENVIEQAILSVMPDYDKSTREKKEGKLLECDILPAGMILSSSFFKSSSSS